MQPRSHSGLPLVEVEAAVGRRGGQESDREQSSALLAFLMLSAIPLPRAGILLLQQEEDLIGSSVPGITNMYTKGRLANVAEITEAAEDEELHAAAASRNDKNADCK